MLSSTASLYNINGACGSIITENHEVWIHFIAFS